MYGEWPKVGGNTGVWRALEDDGDGGGDGGDGGDGGEEDDGRWCMERLDRQKHKWTRINTIIITKMLSLL